jgi:hypothetical protein
MYPHPKDVKEFDRAYREEHLPYAAPRMKGATGFPTIETIKATAASSGKEALTHAASISSGGAPTIIVVTDDAQGV